MPTSPGWYADPSCAPQQRFHDGNGWTSEVRPYPAPAAPSGAVKKRGTGLIVSGLVIAALGVLLVITAAASATQTDAYGAPASSGPTPLTFLIVVVGLILAVIGFCRRMLGAVEKR